MTATLTDRRALVTGSSGGLGISIVKILRREGATVLGADLADGSDLQVDLANAEGVREAVDSAVERLGGLDVLVLNAGVQHVAPIDQFPEEQWDRLQNILVKSVWLAIRESWPALTSRPGARVVVVASTSSFISERGKVAYDTAKTAVIGLVRNAALEGLPHELTVNAIAPTWMRTPLVERQLADRARAAGTTTEAIAAELLAGHPADRFLETDEAAEVVAFLASSRSSGVTGTVIPVDLGELLT